MDPTGESKRRSWFQALRGNVLALGIVSFFTDASSEMIYPLLPVFFTGLVPVASAALYLGLMEGIAESTASLFKILAGAWSDRLGKRKILAVFGYGLSTLCRPAMALARAGWHPVLLRFGDRIGKGVRTAPRDALISDSIGPESRALAFSFHRAMDHCGAVIGPLMAVVILYLFLGYGLWHGSTAAATPAEMTALRWVFACALIPGIAAVAFLLLGVREKAPQPGESGAAALAAAVRPEQSRDSRLPLPRRFYAFLATVTLFTLGNSSDLFLVLYGKTAFDLGLLAVIGLWIVLHLSKIAFSLPGGLLADRLGRRFAIVTGWCVYVAVYIGMATAPAQHLFWTLIVIYGAYYGFTEGAEKALVADFVPSAFRGRAFGLYHGAVGLAALPASLLFGVFWKALGPRGAFTIGASLAAAATILLFVLLSRSRPATEAA
jgi:MFS family permease